LVSTEEHRAMIGDQVPPRNGKRPSMADVGRKAGVSTQTVSRYFSGEGYVSGPTRAQIAAAVAELGYVPNRAAGSLRARRTNIIGVLNVGELNYGAAKILGGLSHAARAARRTLMIAEVDPELDKDAWKEDVGAAIDTFLSAPVDAIIVSTAMQGVDGLLAAARDLIPVVNLSARARPGTSSFEDNTSSIGYDATRHLLTLGHRRIAHLVGPRSRNEALDRERGYLRAMSEAGIPPQILEGATDWWATSGAAVADRLEALTATGIVAANDELALGFMSRMGDRGLRAPQDYSIVGVDDMPAAAFFSPPLTTVAIDFDAIGQDALRAAVYTIDTGETREMTAAQVELTVRASTAPAPVPKPRGALQEPRTDLTIRNDRSLGPSD
jgi:DNA-binding LacI/PurR family transcriptional regulator